MCGLLGWVLTRAIYLWRTIFLDMEPFDTVVTSNIWPGRWSYSRATTISTVEALRTNLLHCLVNLLFNSYSVCLQKRSLVLRLFFAGSRFQPLWIYKTTIFNHSLLYKGNICYDILLWYGIHVTHTKFLDKIRNLLLLLNIPQMESGFRSILKDASDVP